MWFLIGIPVANAQWISAVPRSTFGGYPQTFFDACNNLDQWATVKSVTGYLGSFIHDIEVGDDATLAACLQNLNVNGLILTIEAGAFQPGAGGCGTGVGCFNRFAPVATRLQSLGAGVILVRLQEPLTIGRMNGWQEEDIVNHTVTFMQLVRQSFANIEFTSVEAYPFNSAALLNWWMAALHDTSINAGIPPPNGFEIDHDRNAGWGTIFEFASMISQAHSLGYTFNYIFGSPVAPNPNWFASAMNQGQELHDFSVHPDIYTFESWENNPPDPWFTIPESADGTFMFTIKAFRQAGYFPR